MIQRTEAAALINSTCDDVLEFTSHGEELTDLMNLVVNVFVHRLTNPEASVEEAIAECWDEEVSVVLGWLP